MKPELNKKYIFRIRVDDRTLTYTGTVTSIDNLFITFVDKFGVQCSYQLNNIISFEELKKEEVR